MNLRIFEQLDRSSPFAGYIRLEIFMLKDLVIKNRSYRRFYQDRAVTCEQLKELINIGRLTASGANRQPVRYILSYDSQKNEDIFQCLRWAGYLEDWDGPEEGEKPAAYIVMLEPAGVNAPHDEGIIGQTILLAATEQGLGGCFLANIDRIMLRDILHVEEKYDIKLVIALGYPKEEVVLEEISETDNIKYYRDTKKVHHVPKIKLEDLILNC